MDTSSHPPAPGPRLKPTVTPAGHTGSARRRHLARQKRRRVSQATYLLPALQSHVKLFARLSIHLVRETLRRMSRKSALLGILAIGLAATLLLAAQYASGKVLPGVSVAGVDLTGLTETEAIEQLTASWTRTSVTLRDGNRVWTLPASELGFRLDTQATARLAIRHGREHGGVGALLTSAVSGATLEPFVDFDSVAARSAFLRLQPQIDVAPRDATLRVADGAIIEVEAQTGRRLDIPRLIAAMSAAPQAIVADLAIDLPMRPIFPQVSDISPLIAYAQSLIERPLELEVYDPVADEIYPMALPPQQWSPWLSTRLTRHTTGPRLYLSLATSPTRTYLETLAGSLPAPLTLNINEGMSALQDAVMTGALRTWIPVHYLPTTHRVELGETGYSIARSEGIPYYWIEQVNPERDLAQLSVGDEIALPSRDLMLPLRPVRGKRIVVNLAEQYLRAYEAGAVVFEWPVSTGIDRAPTSPGVFQILSHEDVAYGSSYALCDEGNCGQWELRWFMGVYEISPGLVNGFHGAVTLPDGTYLAGNQVGRPYTYGCIMSTDAQAKLLYDWAEDGTIVEIVES